MILVPKLEGYLWEHCLSQTTYISTYLGTRLADEQSVWLTYYQGPAEVIGGVQAVAEQNIGLSHPNLHRTLAVETVDRGVVVVTEAISGQTLHDLLELDGAFSLKRTLKILRQIANGLDHLHQQGAQHQNLSVDTVQLGVSDHVILTEIGYPHQLNPLAVRSAYLPPEVVRDEPRTAKSDLYSLGLLCYEMLTGQSAFQGSTAAILHAQVYDMPTPLHFINPIIPQSVTQVVEMMLNKTVASRYDTGRAFVSALTDAPSRDVKPPLLPIHHPPTRQTATRVSRRYSWEPLTAVVLFFAVILVVGFSSGFGAASLWQAQLPTPELEISSQLLFRTPNWPTVTPSATIAPPSPSATLQPLSDSPTTAPTATPTVVPTKWLPELGLPEIASGSQFDNIQLAQSITADNQPDGLGTTFALGEQPIYLFFDYADMQTDAAWGHRWQWGDVELASYQERWSPQYEQAGTAWVYYQPPDGFQSGPYQVTLQLDGRTVVTATFVVE